MNTHLKYLNNKEVSYPSRGIIFTVLDPQHGDRVPCVRVQEALNEYFKSSLIHASTSFIASNGLIIGISRVPEVA